MINKNHTLRIVFAILTFLFSITWLTPQATASSILGDFTVTDEIKLGGEFNKMIHERMPVVLDPQIDGYIEHLVKRIAKTMPPQPFPITSAVIDNNSMNAFAVPGGYIYVFTGLILNLKHEDELAAVIGHELAHVSLRHVARRMEKMKLVNIASMMGTLAGMMLGMTGDSNAAAVGQAMSMGSMAGAQSAYLSYTQQNEREADHLGMNYLVDAGFNPTGMVESFKTMKRRQWYVSNNNIPSYLSTHPGLDDRIDYLKERFARMPANYFKRRADDSIFLKIQTLIRARRTDPKVALAHYNNIPEADRTCLDELGLGIILSRMEQSHDAEAAFKKALKECPSDPLILREAGRFYFSIGKMDKASPLLREAFIRTPQDAMALFFIARIQAERKDYVQAIPTMRRVAEMVPHDQEIHYHLGRMLGESGDYFGAHEQLAYAALYKHDFKQAMFHQKKAEGLAKTRSQKKQLSKLQKLLIPPEEE
ncbi:M48 family metallopeptidase [Maridesulfovibrio frigidus]|uniref:M48 family metallopeptidase n=1 Tax=Maridesulfovibrio frigidus TaxID=340956 RepID=UPI000A3DFBA7|nr:M48 family metallopeptidase [Maridesulfovibrio frigidus]